MQQLKDVQKQLDEVQIDLKEIIEFHDRIVNEEILNATFTLLDHIIFKLFKTELYRRICKQFLLVFAFARGLR